MGDFNPSSVTILGSEWRPSKLRNVVLGNTVRAVAMRYKPGNVTPADLDPYLAAINGTPGLALEIVDTLIPTLDTPVTVYPGTNTGATKGSWVDEAAGASDYTDVNKKGVTANYLVPTASALSELSFQGLTAVAAGKRVVSVQANVNIAYPSIPTPGRGFFFYNSQSELTQFAPVDLVINVSGTLYSMGGGVASPLTAATVYSSPQVWINPATGIPWTLDQVNAITNGTDAFGIQKRASAFTGEHRVHGLWLTVTTCPENRRAVYYSTTGQTLGWQRYVLSGPNGAAITALTAATYYWIIVYVINPTGGASITLPILGDPDVVLASSAASATGQHRLAYDVGLDRGIVVSATPRSGEMLPILMENPAGTFNAESQPYVGLSTFAASRAQQVTSAGGTTYGGVALKLGWADINLRPDAPLYVEVRRGAGAETGGGTLDGIATIPTTYLARGDVVEVQVPLAASFVAAAAQYFVYFRSAASREWSIPVLDTDSATVTTISTAQVEGTGIGTTTDSYVNGSGVAQTRYDAPVALLPTTTSPAGLASTLLAAL